MITQSASDLVFWNCSVSFTKSDTMLQDRTQAPLTVRRVMRMRVFLSLGLQTTWWCRNCLHSSLKLTHYVHMTSGAGPPRLHVEWMQALGLARRMRCFLSSMTLCNYSNDRISSKSFVSRLAPRSAPVICILMPLVFGASIATLAELFGNYSYWCLSHLCEDLNLETIDTWETLHHPESELLKP